MQQLSLKTYQLLNLELGTASKTLDYSLLLLILINCAAIILHSVKAYEVKYHDTFQAIEFYSVIIFSVEYILRLWCIVESEKYSSPVKGRIRYMFSAGALIDLLAVLPFYLAVITVDLRFIRVFRLLR